MKGQAACLRFPAGVCLQHWPLGRRLQFARPLNPSPCVGCTPPPRLAASRKARQGDSTCCPTHCLAPPAKQTRAQVGRGLPHDLAKPPHICRKHLQNKCIPLPEAICAHPQPRQQASQLRRTGKPLTYIKNCWPERPVRHRQQAQHGIVPQRDTEGSSLKTIFPRARQRLTEPGRRKTGPSAGWPYSEPPCSRSLPFPATEGQRWSRPSPSSAWSPSR